MAPTFKLQCHFILICLLALRGESRYLEVSDSLGLTHLIFQPLVSSLGDGQAASALRLCWG